MTHRSTVLGKDNSIVRRVTVSPMDVSNNNAALHNNARTNRSEFSSQSKKSKYTPQTPRPVK